MRVPGIGLSLPIEPYLADQELNLSFTYCEGAVHLIGPLDGQVARGGGYVEMTGYTALMRGQF